MDNLCVEKNVHQESSKISLTKRLIDKVSGRAWNSATRAGTLCHEATTLEEFNENLLISAGDDAVESTGDTPYITFLRFMSLDYDIDMDIGDYVGLKRRLLKDFFDSLTKAGVTSNEERVETIIGAVIIAICPLEFLTIVNIYDKTQNNNKVLKRAREEARKRGCTIGSGREETVRDRELRDIY